jgi:DNA polymerase III delta prime subunit
MKAPLPVQGAAVLPVPELVIAHHAQSLFTPIKEWRTTQHVPPVLLLTGLQGVGKRAMAYYIAQWLLCERSGMNRHKEHPANSDSEEMSLFGSPAKESLPVTTYEMPTGDPRPCGECASCKKAFHGSWVDFEEIRAADDEESLKIEQFRKLKSKQGFGAHESDYKVILIPDADRMTTQAANSVLKLLEEPPLGWVFLLTASDTSLLLPTLVSRCQTLRLKPFSTEALELLLAKAEEQVSPERRRLAVAFAGGSWARAIEWTQEAAWKKRAELLSFMQEPVSSVNTLLDWAATDTPSFHRMLDQLESFTMDLIRFSLEPNDAPPEKHPWHNSDAARALSVHARAVIQKRKSRAGARTWWIARAERIAKARQEISLPLNRKLLAQDILLPWTD